MPPKRIRRRPLAEDDAEIAYARSEQGAMPVSLEGLTKSISAIHGAEASHQEPADVGPSSLLPTSVSASEAPATAGTTQSNQEKYRNKYKKRLAISLTQKQAICRYQIAHPSARYHEINQVLGLDLERTTILKIVRDKDKWLSIDSSGSRGYKTCFRASRYAMINRAMALWLQAEHPAFLRSFFVHGYNVLHMSTLASMRGPATADTAAPLSLSPTLPPTGLSSLYSKDEQTIVDRSGTRVSTPPPSFSSSSLLPAGEYDESTAALHSLSEVAADAARQLNEDRRDEEEIEQVDDEGEVAELQREARQAMDGLTTCDRIPPLPSLDFMLRIIPHKALAFAQLYNEHNFKASAGWLEGFRRKLDLKSLPEIAATLEKLDTSSPPFYRVISRHGLPAVTPSSTSSSALASVASTTRASWENEASSVANSEVMESVDNSSHGMSTPMTVDQRVMEQVQAEFSEKSSMVTIKRRRIDEGATSIEDEAVDIQNLDVESNTLDDQEDVEPWSHYQQQQQGLQQVEEGTAAVEAMNRTSEYIDSPEQLYQTVTKLLHWMQRGPVDYQIEDRQGFYRQLDSLREQIVQRAIVTLRPQ